METMGKPDKNINESMKHICDVVQKRIDEAYQKGFNDGKEYALDESDMREAVSYQRGLDDAWEAAKKLSWAEKYGGYGDRLDKVFDRTDTFDFLEYSPNEAIEKLKAYEEKQKADDEIKVGDTVSIKDDRRKGDGIVTKSWENDRYFIMWADGSGGVWDKEYIVKTGRHFDIDKILEEMRT